LRQYDFSDPYFSDGAHPHGGHLEGRWRDQSNHSHGIYIQRNESHQQGTVVGQRDWAKHLLATGSVQDHDTKSARLLRKLCTHRMVFHYSIYIEFTHFRNRNYGASTAYSIHHKNQPGESHTVRLTHKVQTECHTFGNANLTG
jgi:hypothetical protein